LAEKGIYNKKGLTPLESVYSTNVWQVFQFISIETAQDTLKLKCKKWHIRMLKEVESNN